MNIFRIPISFLSLLLFTTMWAEQRKPSGSHSLRYLFSYISVPVPGVPQYSVVGYMDDVLIISYTNESGKAVPRAPWMEKITGKEPLYWENTKKELEKVKKILQDGFKKLMEQKNLAPGLHVLQLIHGCELHEDGSGSSFQRFAFDAQNLMPATDPAADTKKQTECIQNLKNLLQIGEESLLKTVAPQTKVSRRKIGNHTFLTGYAYGFYPRDIEVKWVRNGVKIPWESREILPNPDGTYQVQTKVEVQEGDDEKTYKYMVYHSSLLDTTTVIYEEKSPPLGVIIGGVIGALVGVELLAAVIWVVYSRMKTSVEESGCTTGGTLKGDGMKLGCNSHFSEWPAPRLFQSLFRWASGPTLFFYLHIYFKGYTLRHSSC